MSFTPGDQGAGMLVYNEYDKGITYVYVLFAYVGSTVIISLAFNETDILHFDKLSNYAFPKTMQSSRL